MPRYRAGTAMAAGLKGRLARLKELGLVRASTLEAGAGDKGRDAPSAGRGPPETPPFLEGWSRECDFVWTRELRFSSSLPDFLDPAPFGPLCRRPSPNPAAEAPVEAPIEADRLRFFDLETTGLSGGTGTIAFLAAVGRREGSDFAVRQFFLQDYPGEGNFVALVVAALESGTIVSYNGRAFDLPLLRTRCVMNGLSLPDYPHVDALFAARRLWKRSCGGASLGQIERGALGIERGEDVPGSLIPEVWLGYLRTGDHPLMRLAMSHNAEDVHGLSRVVSLAARIFSEPRAWAASSSLDRGGLGRSLLAAGRREAAEEILEAALADGDEASGILLSKRFRRERRARDLERVVSLLPGGYRSSVEKAKYFEREARNPREALAWAERAASEAPTPRALEELERRIARLRRKAPR
ncbi:MAG: ribonuclease H-like domain-containing protein [Spirochaetaceae bacterium]|nr:ribonuclease H-like domain-containing protein [Spirochaetaceae bacterium]